MHQHPSASIGFVIAFGIFWLSILLLTAYNSRTPPPNPDKARIELGATLFSDPILSGNGTMACASCHQEARAFTDGRPVALGSTGEAHTLNTPSIINAGDLPTLGWAQPQRTRLEQQITFSAQDRADLIAFLTALTDAMCQKTAEPLGAGFPSGSEKH